MSLSYSFVMPPALFIVVCLAGGLLALVWRRVGTALMLAGSLCLYVSSMPVVATGLLRLDEAQIPAGTDPDGAQAIVVLGGDMHPGNKADIPDALGPLSLQRLVWAASLYRRLRLPIAVSGGLFAGAVVSLGSLMQQELEDDLATPVRWDEDRSHTTFENALFTARLLKPENITAVIVVTQAFHMPRAIWSFERVGLRAIPAAVSRTPPSSGRIGDFFPSIDALQQTFLALHEMIGLAYYRLRY